ncbi:MAG: Uma2 family endonuclease [Lachnospiraceae bacterium]|nr:Uma2 family endonuclease [Lachnospiraceae bacterium]
MIKGGKGYTIADIEALPEGERAELIDGEWFWMDAPTWTHQEIQMALSAKIWNYVAEHKGSCKVLPAPFAVYIKKDKFNYVEPDISVICDEEKKSEKGCQGAPDWTIEILSPSSVKMDCERKVKLYREAGVREYWIVDSKTETVTVYDFAHGAEREAGIEPKRYSFSDRIQAGIFEDLYLNLSEMDI